MKNNTYLTQPQDYTILVNGSKINHRTDICDHAPTGLAFGYEGSGPAQAALAVMCEEYGCDLAKHPVSYQDFKRIFIANLSQTEPVEFNSEDVRDSVALFLQR